MTRIALVVLVVGFCAAAVAALSWLFAPGLGDRIDALIPWVICAQNRDHDRAIRACTIVIDRGTRENLVDRVSAYYNRGVAYDDKGEMDRALADYDDAIRLDPNYGSAYFNRALIYAARGDVRRAIADDDQVVRIDPKDHGAFYDRGLLYARLGDYRRAVDDFDQALALRPTFAHAFYERGRAEESHGDLDKALADYARFRELRPSDPDGPKAETRVREKMQPPKP